MTGTENESNQKPTKIYAADFAVIDVIAPIHYKTANGDDHTHMRLNHEYTNEALAKFIEKKKYEEGWQAGQKMTIEREDFDKLHEICGNNDEHPPVAGGSTGGMLAAIAGLSKGGRPVHVDFLTTIGDGEYSDIYKNSFPPDNVNLLTSNSGKGVKPRSAHSFVIKLPEGEPIIPTYIGDLSRVLTSESISEQKISEADIVCVPDSLWEKCDLSVADKMLELRWKHHKDLWLSVPTHADFSIGSTHAQDALQRCRGAIPSANFVTGDAQKLVQLFFPGAKHNLKELEKDAIHELQSEFKKFQKEAVEKGEWKGSKRQVAFITCGDEVAIVTPDEKIKYFPVPKPDKIVDTLGWQDMAYGGFMHAILNGKSPEEAKDDGLKLAKAKMMEQGPRLHNPYAVLNPQTTAVEKRSESWVAGVA